VIAGPLKPAEMISDFPRVMSEIRRLFLAIGILLLATGDGGAERINQEGRILGPAPQVARPTLFNTPEADAVVSAMQIMPVTNPWNEDISQRPRLVNSDAMIAQIKSDLVSGVNGQTGVALVEAYHLP
jgi:hypothetical protein